MFFEMPEAKWQSTAAQVLGDGQIALWRHDRVLGYLSEVRGLTEESITRFNLGYLPFSREGYRFGDYWLPSGILIPWYRDGQLVQLRVRCHVGNFAAHLGMLEDQDREGRPRDKYMAMAGSKSMYHLWGIDTLKSSGFVLVTEGEFDAMIATQELALYEDDLSVVTIGSANNRFDETFIERVTTGDHWIMLATDRDPAGNTNGQILLEALLQRDPWHRPYHARLSRCQNNPKDRSLLYQLRKSLDWVPIASRALVPEGKDITDFVMGGGRLADWFKWKRMQFWRVYDWLDEHWLYYDMMRWKIERLQAAQRAVSRHRLQFDFYGPALISVIAEAEAWVAAYKAGKANLRDYTRIDSVADSWMQIVEDLVIEKGLEYATA